MAVKSAKITMVERDQSYTPPVASTGMRAVIVGYAPKGPLMTPVEVANYNSFEDIFGKTPEAVPYSHMAARRYFNQGSELLFVRVGVDPDSEIPDEQDYKAAYAQVGVNLYSTIGTKAIIESSYNESELEDSPSSPNKELTIGETYKSFYQLKDGKIRKVEFTLEDPENSPSDYINVEDLVNQLNETFEDEGFQIVFEGGVLRIETNEIGAYASLVLIGSNTDRDLWYTLGFIDDVNSQEVATGSDPTPGDLWVDVDSPIETPNLHAWIKFKQAGTDGERYRIRLKGTDSPFAIGERIYNAYLLDGPDIETNVIEVFENISWKYNDDNFWVDVINENSDYVEVDIVDIEDYIAQSATDDNVFFVEQNNESDNQYYQLKNGADGIPINDNDTPSDESDDYIVSSINNRLFREAIDLLSNSNEYIFDTLVCPGQSSNAIIDKMIQLAHNSKRQDFLFICDGPFGLSYGEMIKWHNGEYSSEDMYINTSFGCTYWSWQEDYDEDNGRYVFVPPSVYMLELQAKVFAQYNIWDIPAGPRRGTLNALNAEAYPDEDEMDFMVGNLNSVNPITKIPQYGVVVWDEVTLQRSYTSLRDIHVRHSVNRLKKECKRAMFAFQFEANTAQKRQEAKKRLESVVSRYTGATEGAFYNSSVEILEDDLETDIANQRMRALIQIEPVRGIKDIHLTFNIKNYGGIE